MLDRSIPYYNILMKISPTQRDAVPPPKLPEGYTFSFFEQGNEEDWARIEASVLEFDSQEAAKDYFVRDYMPHRELLKERCLFVRDPQGIPVATATAWFAVSVLGYQPSLHWVGVTPSSQGLGLGKKIIQEATRLFCRTDPALDVFLHTQTWSYKAVKIYHQLGYRMLRQQQVAVMSNGAAGTQIAPNEFEQALSVLEGVLDQETVSALRERAV